MVTLKAQKADSIFGSQGATKTYVQSKINAIPTSTPGGSTTQVQYNSAGTFAGNSNLTYNGTTFISDNINLLINDKLRDLTTSGPGTWTHYMNDDYKVHNCTVIADPAGTTIKLVPPSSGIRDGDNYIITIWLSASAGDCDVSMVAPAGATVNNNAMTNTILSTTMGNDKFGIAHLVCIDADGVPVTNKAQWILSLAEGPF